MKRILLLPPRITARLTDNRGLRLRIILLVLVFITGLYTKQYVGPYALVIHNHAGGIMYVLFGSLLFSVLLQRLQFYWPVVIAFSFTCLLEFIQYFHFPFMVRLTAHKSMAYLFGVSYNPVDFIWYAAGAIISLFLLYFIEFEPSKELSDAL